MLLGIAILAVAWGVLAALNRSWTTDDAFISFRYAENLVNGHGLVFNTGERVEGYTNFLWTLWCAVGIAIGANVEVWAIGWGLFFYAGTIVLLVVSSQKLAANHGFVFPFGAVLAAVHPEWQIYATGGLETSMFILLLLSGYLLLLRRRVAVAGIILALATLTRPDGALLVVLGGLMVLVRDLPNIRPAVRYTLACLSVLVPFLLWRHHYYGDWLPNTYYAKSAYLSWYAQGWTYVRLYFVKYWLLLLALPLVAAAWLRHRISRARKPWRSDDWLLGSWLAAGFAIVYTLYVMKVGGCFMYGRLLIPATPFFLMLFDFGLPKVVSDKPLPQALCAVVFVSILMLTPTPLKPMEDRKGIVDERAFYSDERQERMKLRGQTLKRLLGGLPVRVAFLGSEARLVFYAQIPFAIESETGLTDRFIARQELTSRGRVGHEKHASVTYLIEKRRADFVFHPFAVGILRLDRHIPSVPIDIGGVRGQILHWDEPVLRALQERGAHFPDFPRYLDELSQKLDAMSTDEIREIYRKYRLFYFIHVQDPLRERYFTRRLESRRGSGHAPATAERKGR